MRADLHPMVPLHPRHLHLVGLPARLAHRVWRAALAALASPGCQLGLQSHAPALGLAWSLPAAADVADAASPSPDRRPAAATHLQGARA